jgi:hypothetical protein
MPKRPTNHEATIRSLRAVNKRFDRLVAKKDEQIAELQEHRVEIERTRQDELDNCLRGYSATIADELLLAAGIRTDAGICAVAAVDSFDIAPTVEK